MLSKIKTYLHAFFLALDAFFFFLTVRSKGDILFVREPLADTCFGKLAG